MLEYLVKENEFLYRLWFVLVRTRQTKGKKKLPKASDHLFFTGFPRSGNTYLSGLIRHSFADLEFTDHLHTVASIKIALSNDLKTFVIIRNPLDSVGSFLAYHSDDLDAMPEEWQVSRFLRNYYRYFRFLDEKKDLLYLIRFSNMIVDKKGTIEAIARILGLPEFEFTDDVLRDFECRMQNVETRKRRNSGSLPNERKQAYKARVSRLITANAHFPRCADLFNSLKTETINGGRAEATQASVATN